MGNNISTPLLDWYDRHHRVFPWRVTPGERDRGIRPSPYHVWLSEIMLQQTTVQAVRPYFLKFIEKWPTVADLASEADEEIMKAWAGLGYYSRARNLKKCAERIVFEHECLFPEDETTLKTLPGIGGAPGNCGLQSSQGNTVDLLAALPHSHTPTQTTTT